MAFADNNACLWGREIDGVPILKPEEAAGRFGDSASFIVTIWRAGGGHRLAHTREQLQTLNCSCVVSFAHLYWKYPDVFLPYYCIDLPHKIISQCDDAMKAFRLLADEESRQEYLAQIRFRLFLDFDGLPSPSRDVQYFPGSLFNRVLDEVFIDCGAFDGDTIRAFMEWTGGVFKRIHAFEPDPLNAKKLQGFIAALPEKVRGKIIIHRVAAAEYRGEVGFVISGDASSSTGVGAMTRVDCAPLDEILASDSPTYIKMDIEGAELSALKGAAGLIARFKPVLAVSAYHKQADLWRIPLYIHTLFPGYRLFLRPHNEEAWDLVCYAVPEARAVC